MTEEGDTPNVDQVAQLTKELEESRKECDRYKNQLSSNAARMAEMNDAITSKSEEIEILKTAIEIGNVKRVLAILYKKHQDEIDRYKFARQKSESENAILIMKMEYDMQLKSTESEYFKRVSDIMNKELQTSRDQIVLYKNELRSTKDWMINMGREIKSKLQASRDEIVLFMNELLSNATRMINMGMEIELKLTEIENIPP